MADAQTQAPPTPDIAAQEAARLELARQRKAVTLPPPLDAPNENQPERESAPAVDQAISRQSRERGFESRLRRDRFRDQTQGGGGLSMKDAISLAKNPTPTGLAMKLATPTGGTGPGGVPMSGEEVKKMIGNALIKVSWSNLWLTFGHSIYVIAILFFAGWASNYLRQYIPEVGMEWFPGDLGKKMPKHTLLPLKLGEIVAIAFIMFWVLMIDLIMLGIIGLTLGLAMDAYHAYKSLPFT